MMLIPRRNYGLNLFDEFFNDPFFNNSYDKTDAQAQKQLPIMRTDIQEKDGNYLLDIELPGFKKEDLKIELKDGYLTVTAERAKDSEEKTSSYIRRERYTGACKRTFFVGEQVRQEDIKASFDSGILNLRFPKEPPKPVEEAPKYISIL